MVSTAGQLAANGYFNGVRCLLIASEGPPVDSVIANDAPILDVAAPEPGPTLNFEPVPDLPPELQPDPGDILLSRAFWPWEDLGAQNIPEHWLYMGRKVQGTIAQLAVQTDAGPKLVRADKSGRVISTGDRDSLLVADIPPNTNTAYFITTDVGTESLEFKIFAPQAPAIPTSITLNGVKTGWPYLTSFKVPSGHSKMVVPIDQAQDGQYEITVFSSDPVQHGTLYITAIKAVEEVTILSTPGQEPTVKTIGLIPAAGDIVASAPFATVLAGGAVLDLVAAAAGYTIYVIAFNFHIVTVGNANVTLEDESGNVLCDLNTSSVVAASYAMGGVPLIIGHKLRLHNTSGVASGNLYGNVIYVQKQPS